MKSPWMNISVLALSMSAITTTLYAEEQKPAEVQAEQATATDQASEVVKDAPSVNAAESQASQAANALQKQEGDATKETNLQEVFTSNERQYSLIKKGVISSYYDADYTYYRDSRIDVATGDSTSALQRFRVEEDANHTLSNTFTAQYGLLDNVTLSASLPLLAKKDILKEKTAAGLGDISVFLFFGLVGVVGSYYLYSQAWSLTSLLPALSSGFFATGVLNINNIRDIASDTRAGKKTIPARFGKKKALIYHWFLLIGGMTAPLLYVAIQQKNTYWFLLSYPLFILNGFKVTKLENPDPMLKQLALSTFFFTLLFGISLLI